MKAGLKTAGVARRFQAVAPACRSAEPAIFMSNAKKSSAVNAGPKI